MRTVSTNHYRVVIVDGQIVDPVVMTMGLFAIMCVVLVIVQQSIYVNVVIISHRNRNPSHVLPLWKN